MRGRNNIISHCHYRAKPNIGKGVCSICWIPCACLASVAQLDKNWLPNSDSDSKPRYSRVENCYYSKIFEYYND